MPKSMAMDLILWRHAQAQDLAEAHDDMRRALTARGDKQAQCMATWLNQRLPADARVLCSPALRCQQTARALGRPYETCPELAPDSAPDALLAAAGWPDGPSATLLVGHQPTLGEVIAQLAGLRQTWCPLRKGALWWFRARERDGQRQTLVVSVQSPEMI